MRRSYSPAEEIALHFALQPAQLHHAASRAWLGSDGARHVELGDQLGEGRDVVVALDHRGHRAEMRHRLAIQVPHRRGDGMIVGVDQVIAHVAVTGQMELAHALLGDGVQIGEASNPWFTHSRRCC
jgi:hypothetical protein